MIEPTPYLRLKLRTGETITVQKVGACGTVVIDGPYDPARRWWERWLWDIYTLDAEVITTPKQESDSFHLA